MEKENASNDDKSSSTLVVAATNGAQSGAYLACGDDEIKKEEPHEDQGSIGKTDDLKKLEDFLHL